MAFTLKIIANTPEELQEHLKSITGIMVGYQYHPPMDILVKMPEIETPAEIKPVLTEEQKEELIKNAPIHEEPPQPTLEEVRQALKALRDKKGKEKVKEVLTALGADSVPNLDPGKYLAAIELAEGGIK